MILILLLVFIIIIGIVYYKQYATYGTGAITQNKKILKGDHIKLSNKDFNSFVENRSLNSRLIFISGANKCGKMHLAKLLAKKYGYTVINAKDKTPQEVRREIKIADTPEPGKKITAALKSQIEKEKISRKYIIVGKYGDDELKLLFKGKGHNRNFIFLFVQPQEGCHSAFGKLMDYHGSEKETEYKNVLSETNSMLKSYKNYRLYLIKNCYK